MNVPPSSPASATGEFSYRAGMAMQDFPYPVATVQDAVKEALEDLKIERNRQSRESGGIVFVGTTADHRRAMVTVHAGKHATRLSARIGWWGDEPMTRALMERVGVRLGSRPPEAIPEKPPSSPSANPFFSRDAVPDDVMLRELAESRYRDAVIIP